MENLTVDCRKIAEWKAVFSTGKGGWFVPIDCDFAEGKLVVLTRSTLSRITAEVQDRLKEGEA